ncbi:MAG: type II toxin-antitoxin system RelE/ParE family toxin [Acidimicrobiia bacterium]|nr:type II toxin-antitoxin system RelE/ParE family toxin [Acidimicrobiia bacterium]
MAAFHAVYYRSLDGDEPVRAFLDDLDDEVHAVLAQQIDRLNLFIDTVPHLPFPHSSQVDGELRELRCHYGRQLYRVLCRRSDRLLVLLHMFSKRTAKIPASDIDLAQQRWDDFKERMDAPEAATSGRARRPLNAWFAELLTWSAR